jgi:dihydroorotate dehydrogenase (NAD+) catalytic subunit
MIDLAPNNPYGLTLTTPLVAASGCLGYGSEVARTLGFAGAQASHGLGALITRTTSRQPQRANPLPHIGETPAGLIYEGVEHNPGLRGVLARHGSAWASWNLPVIISLGGQKVHEVAELASSLEGVEGIAGVEIPLNYWGAHTIAEASRLIQAVRAATLLPLLIKLPSQAGDLPALARTAAESGADALCLNSGWVVQVPTETDTPRTTMLCGPAIFPLALSNLIAVRQAVSIPIIAGGGVQSAANVQAMLAAGAQAVALGSVLLGEPWAAQRLLGT